MDMHAKVRASLILDDFFNPSSKSSRSFRECYIDITGDRLVTGRRDKTDARYREALNTEGFAHILGNAINRRMVAEYNNDSRSSIWKKLVKVARVNDFRPQQVVRFGGYGDLPTVQEGGDYTSLVSPSDESSSYAITKRGGIETVTLEMVKNDDAKAIRNIPKKLAQAAHRTLAKFVLGFLRDNADIYDGKALFHVDHDNLSSLALSASGFAAARAALKKQPELGSSDPLNLEPKYLWVPFDLEETATNLFRRNANQDRTFVQGLNVEVVPVWYWNDPDDWCISADPADCPTIEIGFMDGVEEPDIFLQDDPLAGSLFSNDQISYKIRHIYGGAVMDFRGVHKSVVV